MTTFSNKSLYTKGQLDYRCLTLLGNSTEQTFDFKDPLFNVISIEASQGEINTDNASEWITVRCKEIDKKIENGITNYDTSLLLTKSGVAFMKTHTSRFFSKPKDRLDSISISIETITGANKFPSLIGTWVIELEIATVRVPTHADWRNIPDTESGENTSEILIDDAKKEPPTPNKSKPKDTTKSAKSAKSAKSTKSSSKENFKKDSAPAKPSSLESSLLTGTLSLLGIGSAVAMGVNFK